MSRVETPMDTLNPMGRFSDRRHAGRFLAEALDAFGGRADTVVLALPRGGVPVAFEVAQRLAAPLDVLIVRKLGVPGHEELAMGAICSGGVRVLSRDLIRRLRIPQAAVDRAIANQERELARRELAYRGGRQPLDVRDKTCIVVDDGLATGATMRAAIEGLRGRGPRAIVVAVPIAAPETCFELGALADQVVCAATRDPFTAVGVWYEDFEQTSDDEVSALLAVARRQPGAGHDAHV
jgi:putative phosphoribosyl transferase